MEKLNESRTEVHFRERADRVYFSVFQPVAGDRCRLKMWHFRLSFRGIGEGKSELKKVHRC